LEVPLNTKEGEVRADALVYRQSPDLILLCECKSGKNVDVEQAEKYLSLDVSWLRRSGAVPPPLRESTSIAVQTLYVGTDEHRPDLEQRLQQLGAVPLLTVSAERIQLSGAGRTPGLLDFIELHSAGLPPARLPVDHQSEDHEVLELLVPAIVAAQASLRDHVGIDGLCGDILPEWPILGERARREFIGRVTQLAKGLAAGEMKGQFRYEPPPASSRTHLAAWSSPTAPRPDIPRGAPRPSKHNNEERRKCCGGKAVGTRSPAKLPLTSLPKREGWPMSERT